MDGQHQDQDEEAAHHPFGDPLQAVSETQAADQKARDDGNSHPEAHLHGIGQKGAEHAGNGFRVQSVKGSGEELKKVADHPAGDCGIIHHQQVASQHTEPAVDVPFTSGLFQGLIAVYGAFSAGAAHGQFHGQYGNSHT